MWPDLGPSADDEELDALTLAEMGPTYCSGWVLLAAASSIEDPRAPSVLTRYTPQGQHPFLTRGIIATETDPRDCP